MRQSQIPPHPGAPERAHHWLPLGRLGMLLLGGALFCVAATLLFVWLAAGIFANRFLMFDDSIILDLNRYWGPTLDDVMLFFTTMGNVITLTIIIVVAVLALLRWRRWLDAGAVVLASAGGGILNQVLKQFYARVRPDIVDSPFHLTSYSFPSGHSMGSITCYGILAIIAIRLLHHTWQKMLVALAAALLILSIGLSRIYFGVHFPTDVLGGFIAGATWLVVSYEALQVGEWYAQRRARRHIARDDQALLERLLRSEP